MGSINSTEHTDEISHSVDETLLAKVEEIADRAGEVILGHYQGQVETRVKADESPVTVADEAAEALILPELRILLPDVPTVSEEAVAAGSIPVVHGPENPSNRFWLVDPLDGTKEFISRNGEFTVNIALIERGRPVLGVVGVPARSTTYGGISLTICRVRRNGAIQRIAARRPPEDGVIVVSSRSHGNDAALDRFLASKRVKAARTAGSSLKFCLIAEGVADLYPRFGRTMEWDTAAGHAVLAAAGGRVTTVDEKELTYGKPGFENPHFIARGLLD